MDAARTGTAARVQRGQNNRVAEGVLNGTDAREVRDELEDSDARSNRDIELAMLQIKTETLARVEEALVRLDAGAYGRCFACAAEISATRLRALPFAVRCTKCEERREHGQRQEKQLAQSRGGSLFPDQANS